MYLFWEIMYVVVTLLCVVILPFAIFYYEVRVRTDWSQPYTGRKLLVRCIRVRFAIFYYERWGGREGGGVDLVHNRGSY